MVAREQPPTRCAAACQAASSCRVRVHQHTYAALAPRRLKLRFTVAREQPPTRCAAAWTAAS
eukprot:4910525-Prymnesium_polylepis.1